MAKVALLNNNIQYEFVDHDSGNTIIVLHSETFINYNKGEPFYLDNKSYTITAVNKHHRLNTNNNNYSLYIVIWIVEF